MIDKREVLEAASSMGLLPNVVEKAREVFHPYTHCPADGIRVNSYAYEEAFGEKVRALGERTRPRALYDVVNVS